MELLAGEPSYEVTLSQSGCRFKFDFSKVYYNPRLSTEHDALVSSLKPKSILVDVCAGVGPFVIRAGHQNHLAIASDLNPEAIKALHTNVKINKLQSKVFVRHGDAKERIRSSVLELWNDQLFGSKLLPDYYLLNLPDSAISFLDSFVGLYHPIRDQVDDQVKLPLIHCYCFTKLVEQAQSDICQRVSEVMRYPINQEQTKRFELKFIRQVAPHKEMYRISFELPIDLAFRQPILQTS